MAANYDIAKKKQRTRFDVDVADFMTRLLMWCYPDTEIVLDREIKTTRSCIVKGIYSISANFDELKETKRNRKETSVTDDA